MKYYIAYGSNLNKKQMQRRCPGAKAVGTAVLEDTALAFRRGVLTIIDRPGSQVQVGVWEINADHERSLDIYEGFPNFYRKVRLDLRVDFNDGTERACPTMVYVMAKRYLPSAPSDYYYQTCVAGFRDFGFDTAALAQAAEEAEAGR